MSKLSEYLTNQTTFNSTLSDAIDALTAAVGDISTEITTLNTTITNLQNSPGGVTPEDQATIDTLQAQGTALVAKAAPLVAAAKALDTLNPPTVPTTPAA